VLVGRESEQARIAQLVARTRDGVGGALIVRGEPGVGKTALLADAAEQALGMRVLRVRGVESECELAFSGLHELLRPLLGRLAKLPEPQAVALRGALGIGPPVNSRLLIAAGALSVLSSAAEERPLLLLVDDAHWLDSESAAVLAFVARRVEADPVLLLFGARDGDQREFAPPGIDQLRLSGLQREAAGVLLRPEELEERVVDELHRATSGNPLALLELPRVLTAAQRTGAAPVFEPLPVSEAVQAAFGQRIHALPDHAQRALMVAAAESSSELRVIGRACADLGIAASALEDAEATGLVDLGDTRITFRHPLVRSAAYYGLAPSLRRTAHRALAEATGREPERRAWHLAAAALGPDEEVAVALESAGAEALRRGALGTAAAAYERAADLTPETDDRVRRLYRAAEAAYAGGVRSRAESVLEQALRLTDDSALRFELLLMQTSLAGVRDPRAARRFVLSVFADVAREDCERAALLAALCSLYCARVRAAEFALEAAELSAQSARSMDAFVRVVRGVAFLLNARFAEARPLLADTEALPDYVRGALACRNATLAYEASVLYAEASLLTGRLESVAPTLEIWARPPWQSPTVLSWVGAARGAVDYRLGRWTDARAGLAGAVGYANEAALVGSLGRAASVLAELAGAQGALLECRRYDAEAASAQEVFGAINGFSVVGGGARALLALGLGQHDEAIATYESAILPALGPLKLYGTVADALEAYARGGRAAQVVDLWEEFASQAAAAAWPWALARASHLRGLAADEGGWEEPLREALHWHDQAGEPFPRARTQLLLGERLRRANRRVDSRDYLRQALACFERLEAAPWARRARAELRATGERVRKRSEPRTDELTPQELQVALVVARGATNKEAAETLFLSPKTIEKHLGNVYAKLRLRSRTELAAVFTRPATEPRLVS
jgi:DNA-binding CsgD family transcriptional regulator